MASGATAAPPDASTDDAGACDAARRRAAATAIQAGVRSYLGAEAAATRGATAAPSVRAASATGGCEHYDRGCRVLAPCCGRYFSCRLCHDAHTADDGDAHKMDRFAVTQVMCNWCAHEQAPAAACEGCGATFGAYFCAVCNLFDNDLTKDQFHCDKCGICRVGGRENFFHCETCGACYSNELRGNHVCVPNAMSRNCPVCFDFLFDSLEAPQVLRCGHTIHRRCLEEYHAHGGYTCPLCCASVCDMASTWDEIDEEIAHTPLPAELSSRLVPTLCNDCHSTSQVPYHFLGLKCAHCGSYNTRQR